MGGADAASGVGVIVGHTVRDLDQTRSTTSISERDLVGSGVSGGSALCGQL